jgi:hypothetical protein
MTIPIDDRGRGHGGARRDVLQMTIALGLAAATALVASATGADASAAVPQISAWSSGFDDWSWTANGLERPRAPSSAGADWSPECFVTCGAAFATYGVRRTELLSSNTADLSVNRVVDSTGHAMALSGMIVIERLEADGFGAAGSLTDWVVVGERALDGDGTHSWSLLSPDISPDAHWLPIELYRFEDASFSMSFAAAAPGAATPEASTWAMTLIGCAALGVARYRRSTKHRRAINAPEGLNA